MLEVAQNRNVLYTSYAVYSVAGLDLYPRVCRVRVLVIITMRRPRLQQLSAPVPLFRICSAQLSPFQPEENLQQVGRL